MKKIRLQLEALTVESFYLAEEEGSPRGTVLGRSGTDFDCVPTAPPHACIYPTAAHHSCQPGETVDQNTCNCLYPDTDIRMCCTGDGCSGMC